MRRFALPPTPSHPASHYHGYYIMSRVPPLLCLTVHPTVHERRQACGFRDNYEKFVAAGYTILGCSGDGAELQSSWKEKQSYQFDFVCDEGLAFSTSVGMKMDGREMSARSAQDIRTASTRDSQAPAAACLATLGAV